MTTFLFTDIIGSTLRWQLHPVDMPEALARHDSLVGSAVERNGGRVVKHTGDGFMAVFDNGRALECALALQAAIQESDWSAVDGLEVRVGVHSGEALESGGDFFGDAVNRASRLTAAAWGGQVLASAAAAAVETLPEGASMEDAGIHMLKDLLEPLQLFVLTHPSLRGGFPPPASVTSSPHNLPVQPTPFVGRQRELQELTGLLADTGRRHVTILGHGGSGKTRLALQAVAEVIGSFPQGSWFVPLEDVSTLPGMVSRTAETLGLRFSGPSSEEQQLAGFLRSRDMLLVLDNFEHVTAHAPLVSRLLAGCPGLRTIATSRHRLGIREETVFDLSGMNLPEGASEDLEGADSTRLFMSSARRALPGFVPGPGDAASIVRICRMLEGLPLALELSAPWIRTISCRELESELERGLDLLESPGADLPERQRNMQAVFEYSWSLLTCGERTALAGLAVFEGGFDREAALEVAGCGLGTLRRLCDRSLVRPRPGGGYSLHPLTRQQAVERQGTLEGGRDAVEERHSRYFCDLLRRLHPGTRSSRQTEVLDRVSLELPNLRKGALHAFRSGDRDRSTSYAKTISILFQLRSRFSEGLDFFREVGEAFESSGNLGDPGDAARTRVELLERRGTFLLLMGRCAEALPCLENAVEISGTVDDPILQALCCGGLGNACHVRGDLEAAEKHWRRALTLARENGVAHSVSSLLCNIATVKKQRGLHSEALALLAEAENLNRDTGDPYITAVIMSQMADLLEVSGDSPGAERKYRESLDLRRRVGDLRGMSHTFQKLSSLVMHRSPAEALELAREGLHHAESSGAVNRVACTRAQLARALASNGSMTEAWDVLAEAEAEAARIGLPNVDRECTEARAMLESLDRREG